MTNIADEIIVTLEEHVALVEMRRAPHNFVDIDFISRLADVLHELDTVSDCRAVVLFSGVSSFCAGADFSRVDSTEINPAPFYGQAMRLFRTLKPMIVAISGPAIGAGMGLILVGDFRIACAEARFSANFCQLGIHPGFGMSLALPRLIGQQKAASLFYTGRRIGGEEALSIGLIDELVESGQVLARAKTMAKQIAAAAPLAVQSTRATLRRGLADDIAEVNQRELAIQLGQFNTADFREGIMASMQRRAAIFKGN